jgi:hypothetical protein
MTKYINIKDLISNKHIYRSVTISQENDYFQVNFYHKLKLRKDGTGCVENKKFKYVAGTELLPQVSNDNVKHLGYTKYFHLMEQDFYINLYFRN